jgi:flagellar biosynthesis protein FlhF
MKIKRFKGRSLEKMYDVINREMGADAIVIPVGQPSGMKSVLPSFLGGEEHELIAVVDDRVAERQTIDRFIENGQLNEALSAFRNSTVKQVDQVIQKLKGELKILHRVDALPMEAGKADRAFGLDWDQRFVKGILSRYPDFFDTKAPKQRTEMVHTFFPITEQFPVAKKERPHVVVLVGPTGSGKTTTLAKLAARWSLDGGLKVGIITTDTYRVAAVDQIKEYASLLGLDLRVAFSTTEAGRAVKTMSQKDVILVDTPGRSHYDQAGLTGLRGILGGFGAVTVMLMVPATWDRAGLGDMIKNFSILSPNYTVITKVDEARRFDLLTVVASETKSPIAFLTNGQRVPQDIHSATVKEIADLLMPITGGQN